MDAITIETGLKGFASPQEPNRRHRHENSLRKFGLLFMLFGASTVYLTIGSSSANHECDLIGFALLLVGFMLLILSEFDYSGVTDGFAPARKEPNRRRWHQESSLRRYGLLLMLFGASIDMLTIGNSSSACNPEHVFLGITVLLFGFLLLVLSEFRGGAGERFIRPVVGALGELFGRHN